MTTDMRTQVQALYQELGPALLLYARSIVPDVSSAEDALHQVFLKLLSGEAAMPEDPRPYLYRSVRNAALNARRGEVRERARSAGLAETRREAMPMFTAPQGLDEARGALEEALSTLPDEQREVVVLRTWGEMTFDQVGDLLGIPPNTAASRHRYALEKLRERLARWAE